MPARHQSSPRLRTPHHANDHKGHRALRGLALALVVVVVFGASSAAAVAQRLQRNITTVDVSSLVGPRPTSSASNPSDPSAGQPINILIMGSDTRSGDNAAIGGADPGERSDTAIVAHISADRTRVEMVSIPRDSLVKIPACKGTNGKTSKPAASAMFNSAYSTGWSLGGDVTSAAACAINTVQADTGVPIDHFAVVDFSGFQSMVNAIGGVPICIPRPLKDSQYTGLDLAAGQQVLNGQQALQLARARHGNVGNGGDIDRIGNQQRLISAMVNEVLSKKVLTNPTALLTFMSAATKSLTVDSGLQLQNLSGLAYNLRNIGRDNIVFLTIPTGPAPNDGNRLVWTSAAADIWANLAADKPVTQSATPTSPTATSSAPIPTSTAKAGSAKPTTAPTASAPAPSKSAGHEAFTSADTTAVCS